MKPNGFIHSRRHYAKCKTLGQCVSCSSASMPGRVLCPACATRNNAQRLERRQADIKARRCVTCRHALAREMGVECDFCADENRFKSAARRARRRNRRRAA